MGKIIKSKPSKPKFDHHHYVPILKGKRAEFPAIGSLKSDTGITPLLEGVPSASFREIPRQMAKQWSANRPYFIDFLFLDDPDNTTTPAPANHPLLQCFDEVDNKNQSAIPVTGISRSPAYQDAAKQIVSDRECGLAIRLTSDDFEEETEDFETVLETALEFFELEASEVDLLLDIGSVAGRASATVAQMHRANIDLLPNLNGWRTLTVVSGAFPISLAPLTRDQWNPASRSDWRGWRRLVTGSHPPARLPAFGDYAIAHPDLPPEGRATILAQLRYATADSWLIWKGRDVFRDPAGFNQFRDICQDLVGRPEYRGANFSQGDGEIQQKAATGGSPGNAETWRRIGTNHHLETVLEQIASLP